MDRLTGNEDLHLSRRTAPTFYASDSFTISVRYHALTNLIRPIIRMWLRIH